MTFKMAALTILENGGKVPLQGFLNLACFLVCVPNFIQIRKHLVVYWSIYWNSKMATAVSLEIGRRLPVLRFSHSAYPFQ
jgi:hypothetical protein